MPFTIEGEWVPNKEPSKRPAKPVKVRQVKRGKSILTVILNLSLSQKEAADLASKIKKKLGCGGSVTEDGIEIQGDKVAEVKAILETLGIKSA